MRYMTEWQAQLLEMLAHETHGHPERLRLAIEAGATSINEVLYFIKHHKLPQAPIEHPVSE